MRVDRIRPTNRTQYANATDTMQNCPSAMTGPWRCGDRYEPSRRDSLRRALAELDARIDRTATEIELAERRRGLARRLVVAMVLATAVTSIAALACTVGALVPLAPAMWVLPSALGGSAVSQSATALRESARIRDAGIELASLRRAREAIARDLACYESN